MNITFIYENGFASNNGSNHLLCATIENMLKGGNVVHLIEGVTHRDGPDYPKSLECNAFTCDIIQLTEIDKRNYYKRYLNGLKFARFAVQCAKKYDTDMFFVQSTPTVSFTILGLKKYHKPIVYNIFDIFPGSAYELGILKSKFLDFIFKKIQKVGFKKSDKIIVVSDDMQNKIAEQGIENNKISIINTWFDEDSVRYVPDAENSFVKEYDIDTSKLIIQYAGNVGQVFGLVEFSKVVNELSDRKDIEFHIVGSGVKKKELEEKTKGSNIKFFEWQPQNRMSEIYSYCDLEVIPLHHGVIGNDVPSKMALAMACGKPVFNIVEKSHYYDLFQVNHIGFSFEQSDIYGIVDKLKSLTKSELKTYKQDTISFALKNFSKNKNNKKLMQVLNDVVER